MRRKDEFRTVAVDRGGTRFIAGCSDGILRHFLVGAGAAPSHLAPDRLQIPPLPPRHVPCPPQGMELPMHNGVINIAEFSQHSDRFLSGCAAPRRAARALTRA